MTNTIEIENLNISDLDIPTDETLQEVATACENIATSSESIATSCDNVATSCNDLAKDTTLQSTNTALGSLATDATLQATNTALGSISGSLSGFATDTTLQAVKGSIDSVASTEGTLNTTLGAVAKDATLQSTNTALSSLMADTTGQSIASAINSLAGAISPAASNVTFDNTGTGLSASNVQAAIAEVNNNYKDNTCSIERASGVSSSLPLPTIMRRGKVVIVDFSFQIPAGSYGTAVWVVSPVPINNMHSIVYYSNSPTRLTLYTSGTLGFTAPITPTSSGYINGQLIYLTDD